MPPFGFKLPTRRDKLVVNFTISPSVPAGSWTIAGNTYPYNRRKDQAPTAADEARYGGIAIPLDTQITFEAVTKSISTALRAVHYRWNFSDGTTATGPVVRRVYKQVVPSVTVTLTVLDNRGGRATRARVFQVGGVTTPPPDPEGPEVPLAPTGLGLGTGSSGTLNIAFTPPVPGEQNNPVLSYQYTLNGGLTWTTISTSPFGQSRVGTITGLTNGTPYTVAVRAVNVYGPGAPSNNATASPIGPTAPSAPTGLTVQPGNTNAVLTWTPGVTNEAATSWQWSTDGSSWTTLAAATTGSQRTFTITGLTNGVAYDFRVRGVNANGNGVSSAIVTATPTAPGAAPLAATGLTATPGNTTVALQWTPAATGDPATSWEYTINAGTNWNALTVGTSGANRTATVTGLTNGVAYTFAVRGVNSSGNGASSGTATATPAVPVVLNNAPTGLGAAAGNAQVVLTFTPPTTGDTPTSYQYSTNGGSSWTTFTTSVSGSQRTGTITSLTNGQTYTFIVRAVNAAGNSPASTSATATPAAPLTAPNAATALTASPGNAQIALQWTPSASGGAATSWQYTTNSGTNWLTFTTTASGSNRTGTITQTSAGVTLTNGVSYTIQVRGVNSGGNGAASNSASATPVAPSSGSGSNMWMSAEMISAASTTSAAWNRVVSDANASWGTPAVADQDTDHDTFTMAGALYYAKTGNSAMRTKVRNAIMGVIGTESTGPFYSSGSSYSAARSLAVGRNLGAYPIAAQLIDLQGLSSSDNTTFSNWLNSMHSFNTTGGGEPSITACMDDRPNNWGTWCQFSIIAAALYTNNTSRLNHARDVLKGYLGNRSVYAGFNYGDLTWQGDNSNPRGINSQGATKTISGASRNVDGCVPDDQRRANTSWPPAHTNYYMEACEGITAAIWLLHRSGTESLWTYENSAIVRAHNWYQNVAGFAFTSSEADHAHTPWILNKAGYSQFTRIQTTPGKGYGYVDWSHA